MSADVRFPGSDARRDKGWWGANRFLILRRLSQFLVLMLFLSGPWFGVWIAKGNLASSLTLDVLPLTDPYLFLQSLSAGFMPTASARDRSRRKRGVRRSPAACSPSRRCRSA